MTAPETAPTHRADAAAAWWWSLQDQFASGAPNPRANRKALAVLRRADLETAMTEDVVFDLHRRLYPKTEKEKTGPEPRRLTTAVRLALVLAHVRENDRPDLARALGRPKFIDPGKAEGPGEAAILKPLRFQRLLAAREDEDVVREFRRAVDLLRNRANVRDLARLLLTWHDDRTRTRFAFDYFAAGPDSVPAATEPSA